MLSIRFARALAGGRRLSLPPDTRERLLVTLLKKRATARTVGDEDLESLLRAQILWALPTLDPETERDAA